MSARFVKRLRVTGPCSLQLQVVMRNLQELEVGAGLTWQELQLVVQVVPLDAREVGQDWQQGQVCSYSTRGER